MGAAAGVQQFPYDYPNDTPDADGNDHSVASGTFLPNWMRRSLSNGSGRYSPNGLFGSGGGEARVIEPIKPNFLNVPVYDKHPFAEYRFQRKLGEGSFSTVFKGVLSQDERIKVAIKEINLQNLKKQQLADLNMEMNLLSQLNHESIVQIFAVYTLPTKTFLITEYLQGGELLTAICLRDHYHESDARRIMYQVTSALHYMHAKRVIHRDIKPMNLILAQRTFESPIKIVDFGFATIESEESKRPGRLLCGTPGYIAPEVLTQRSYSCKVDVWSLGVVFYVLLSGWMPFPADESGEAYIKSGTFSFPQIRFERVSSMAKDLLQKMLTVDVNSRYSALQVLQHPWMQLATPKRKSDPSSAASISSPRSRLSSCVVREAVNQPSNHRRPSQPEAAVLEDLEHSLSKQRFAASLQAALVTESDPSAIPKPSSKPNSKSAVDDSCEQVDRRPSSEVSTPILPSITAANASIQEDDDEEDDDQDDDAEEGEEVQELLLDFGDGDLSDNLQSIREYHSTSYRSTGTTAGFARRLWNRFTSSASSTKSPMQRYAASTVSNHNSILPDQTVPSTIINSTGQNKELQRQSIVEELHKKARNRLLEEKQQAEERERRRSASLQEQRRTYLESFVPPLESSPSRLTVAVHGLASKRGSAVEVPKDPR